jgi:hypothetical protein
MATRLYLANAAAGYTPTTIRGAWGAAGRNASSFLASPTKAGAAATQIQARGSGTLPIGVLCARFITIPLLSGGALAGTVAFVNGLVKSSVAGAGGSRCHIFVTEGDTDVVRGTLLTDYIPGDSMATTADGRGQTTPQSLASVTVQVGDRLCIETGGHFVSSSSTSHTVQLNYGNTGATDLTLGSTAVTTQPGWFEFSALDPFLIGSGGPTHKRGQFSSMFPGGV